VDAGVGILYINGEKVAEMPGKQKIATDWSLGARVGCTIDNARFFTGLMDDFCIWKRALSQDEIKNLMESGPVPMAVLVKGNQAITWGQVKFQKH